jgi:transcriptional regulator with XRE-family HTH domain
MEGQAVSADDVPMGTQHTTPDMARYRELLAERLQITRQLLEPRQVETARKLGFSQSVWFRYETGYRRIEPAALALFCLAYEVNMDWLVLGNPEKLRQPLRNLLFTVPRAQKYLRNLPRPAELPASPQDRYADGLERLRKALTDPG